MLSLALLPVGCGYDDLHRSGRRDLWPAACRSYMRYRESDRDERRKYRTEKPFPWVVVVGGSIRWMDGWMAFKWGKMKSSAKGNGKARKSLKLNPVMCKGHDRPPQGTTIYTYPRRSCESPAFHSFDFAIHAIWPYPD